MVGKGKERKLLPQGDKQSIAKPSVDDRAVWEIIFGCETYLGIAVAISLGLFDLFENDIALKLEDVCKARNLSERPASALLSLTCSLGLTEFDKDDATYRLAVLGRHYFLRSSPTYLGGFIEARNNLDNLFSVSSLKKAVLQNSPQAYGSDDIFKSHEEQAALARNFTYAMHSVSMGPALSWPSNIDLNKNKTMLDIGGGSGAHCIGALSQWPSLKAIVFDISPVCQIAAEYARQYGLQDRISTHSGDMWTDPFPSSDLHFYSMIFHDWPKEKCEFLAQKSFESLPVGGRIVIHEMLFDDLRIGPPAVAAFNIDLLLWVPGQQYSGRELSNMLERVGFGDLEVKPTTGYWSIVTGKKLGN